MKSAEILGRGENEERPFIERDANADGQPTDGKVRFIFNELLSYLFG